MPWIDSCGGEISTYATPCGPYVFVHSLAIEFHVCWNAITCTSVFAGRVVCPVSSAAFAVIGTASRAPVPTMAMATPMPVVRRMQSLTC